MLCQNIKSHNSAAAAAAAGQQILGDRKPLKKRCFGEWTPSRETKKNLFKNTTGNSFVCSYARREESLPRRSMFTASSSKTWNQIPKTYKGKKSATRMPTARSNAFMKLSYVSEHQGTPCRRKAEKGKQEVPCPETERTFNLFLKSVIRQS